jgi:LysR family transcriptional regulator, low CO2-responsive transcriptional regulator
MKPSPSPDAPNALTLARLRALTAVAETGTFSAAARSLGVSHSSVAQQVREVELAHMVHLFDRVGGLLQATPLCLELCDIGHRMQEAERDAALILGRRTASSARRLRVGLGNAMPGIAIIGQFLAQHAGVSVTVQTGSHQFIVAFLPDLPADARFRRAAVVRQEVVAIVGTQSPLVDLASVSLARLAQEPLIYRTQGSSTQKIIDRALRHAGLTPQPRLVADTRDAVYEAVAVGIGVGFMWRFGTYRNDAVRRIPISDLRSTSEEVVFAMADERNSLLDMFFHAAERFSAHDQAPGSGG